MRRRRRWDDSERRERHLINEDEKRKLDKVCRSDRPGVSFRGGQDSSRNAFQRGATTIDVGERFEISILQANPTALRFDETDERRLGSDKRVLYRFDVGVRH